MDLAPELEQDAVYNAHYLALAEALNCELWTADERFYRAASSGHTQVRWIGSFAEG
jgi:predicted nucleic acid-binding protein